MKNSQAWTKRFLCWMIILSMAVGMQFSFAEGSEGTADQPTVVVEVTPEPTAVVTAEPTAAPTAEPTAAPTAEPTAVPTAEPTAVPTPEPTAVPTAEPTAAPQAAEPTQEVTAAPATSEPTQEATASPEVEEPTSAPATEEPTAEPSQEPEPVYYTGYAKLTEKTKVYNTENTNTVAYRLPSDSIVYVDHVVLEDAERVYVSYSIDAKKAGGFVALSGISCMTEQQQDDFVTEIEKAGVPAYYDDQKQIPLQEVIPEYPATVAAQSAALPTEEPVAEKVPLDLTQAEMKAIVTESMKNDRLVTYNCTTVAQLQSPHPYGNNRRDLYVYTQANAAKISITFSNDSYLERNYDFVSVYDAKDNLVDNTIYTGAGLAGRTITVTGNTVKIYLYTDSSNLFPPFYGFRVTSIGTYKAPAAPAAAAVDSTHVRLSWSASARISGYHVYRASSPNGTYTYLGATTGTSYTATVPYGQLTYFKIRGYSTIGTTKYLSGYSPYRAMYALKTPAITSVAKVSATQLKVQWSAVGNVEKYQLYHSTSQNGTYTLIKTTTLTNATLTLNNTQGHYFKVRAIKTISGVTYYSGFSPVKSFVFNIGQVTLNGPTILASNKISLSWPAVPGVTGYQIYRSGTPNGTFTKIGETSLLTYTDNSCLVGQINYYRVRGYVGALPNRTYGAFSTIRTGFGMGGTPLSISRSGTTTTLTWNKVTNADGYLLYRSSTENNNYVQIAKLSGTSYNDLNVDAGWYYKVRPYKVGSNGVTYQGPASLAKTIGGGTYRALLIGNAYSGSSPVSSLSGTINDANGMKTMLGRMTNTSYTVTLKTEQTASGILSQITSAFSGAKENDVSLFFYSGHGTQDTGYLVGYDGNYISPTQLRTRLDTIPGKKIVLIDACFSGNMIGKADAKAQSNAFVSAFINEFAKADRSNLAASNYYVITACHSTQTSQEYYVDSVGPKVGFFTYAFCKGAGWDYSKGIATSFPADTNGDRNLSLQEMYSYAYSGAMQFNPNQAAQVYPTNSSFKLFGY